MERITRADLKLMHTDFVASQQRKMVANIVEQVKRTAQQGQVSYTHVHIPGFPGCLEVVERLRSIFVDLEIEYAEPFITVRWN